MGAALEAKRVRHTLRTAPPYPLTHWSSRQFAAKLGAAHTTVPTVWKRYGLKPHRLERYKGSPDPVFETKEADILGLYITPSIISVVLCIDAKTAIQALGRTDPVMPLRPGRAEAYGSSTCGTGPARCARRSTSAQATCRGKSRCATPLRRSWTSSRRAPARHRTGVSDRVKFPTQ